MRLYLSNISKWFSIFYVRGTVKVIKAQKSTIFIKNSHNCDSPLIFSLCNYFSQVRLLHISSSEETFTRFPTSVSREWLNREFYFNLRSEILVHETMIFVLALLETTPNTPIWFETMAYCIWNYDHFFLIYFKLHYLTILFLYLHFIFLHIGFTLTPKKWPTACYFYRYIIKIISNMYGYGEWKISWTIVWIHLKSFETSNFINIQKISQKYRPGHPNLDCSSNEIV